MKEDLLKSQAGKEPEIQPALAKYIPIKDNQNQFFNQLGSNYQIVKNIKCLPPYGKALQAKLQQGIYPKNGVFLWMGIEAWRYAKTSAKFQAVLVLPYNEEPEQFIWPVVNQEVFALDTACFTNNLEAALKSDYIRKTGYCLLQAGASIVRACSFYNTMVIYRRTNNAK